MNGIKAANKRETELDILRILALLAVISVHCTEMGLSNISITENEQRILIFFDSAVTWQIPIYVMISGRFFLDPKRDISSSKVFKAIRRLVIAFVVWDVIYQIYYILDGAYVGLNWKGILTEAFIGPYHFWYLYMQICLYIIVPFLRKIVESKKLMEYYILLFFIFEFLTYYAVEFPVIGTTIAQILTKTNFHFAMGYTGYFVLGYYLYKYKVPKRFEYILYGVAIILLLIASAATIYRVSIEGQNNEWYTKYLMPNIAVEAIAIYTFFTKRVSKFKLSDKVIRWVAKLSDYSFGVYLVHALVAEVLGSLGVTPIIVNPIVMVPSIVLLVFAISNILVWSIRYIPYIGTKIT